MENRNQEIFHCRISCEKYPGNRMLGWRELIDGKVCINWKKHYSNMLVLSCLTYVWSLVRTIQVENIQGSLWGSYPAWFCVAGVGCSTCKHTGFNGFNGFVWELLLTILIIGLPRWDLWVKLPPVDCDNGGLFKHFT